MQLGELPYDARVRAISAWANRHRGDAAAAATIRALSADTPTGAPVEVAVDDDMTELFPPQQTNVTSQFHVHQAGVFAAAASQDKETLMTAATSASRLMKRLAVKEVTRLGTDQELDAMIRAALPVDRKEFMHQCMRFRKHAVLDAIFPAVIELDGASVAARVLHGLSDSGVAKHLPTLIANKRLLWPKLWRFHEPVLLAALQTELQAAHRLEVASVWSKWQAFFTAPLVRTTHHKTWRALLALFLAHRPITSCITTVEGSREATELSKQGLLVEDADTVKFVMLPWVRRDAMPATVRDPDASDPSTVLLDLIRSGLNNLDDDAMDTEGGETQPVELLHGSLATDALYALQSHPVLKLKKFCYPFEAVLEICKRIIGKAPLSFVYYSVGKHEDMTGSAAYRLAMSTLQTVLGMEDTPVALMEKVLAVVIRLTKATSPTPANLGINLEGNTLLAKVGTSTSVRSMMDTWLELSNKYLEVCLRTLRSRAVTLAAVAGKQKDCHDLCATMSVFVASVKQVHVAMGELSAQYAKVWPDLENYQVDAMRKLERHLVRQYRHLVPYDTRGEEENLPIVEVYRSAATAIVKETLLPHWRARMMFDRGDEHGVGGLETAQTRVPWTEETAPLVEITEWLKHQRQADESLVCEVLQTVTDWSDWVFSLPPGPDGLGSSKPYKHSHWAEHCCTLLTLCERFQSLAVEGYDHNGDEACPMPTLAVAAFEAVLAALKLPTSSKGTERQTPRDSSVMMHNETGYISALARLPGELRSDAKGPAVEIIIAHLQQLLAEKDCDVRAVVRTIGQLPKGGIKEAVVAAALVPGGALDSMPATHKLSLHEHADLTDKDLIKLLRKATDGSQISRRVDAMSTLLQCAKRSEDMQVMTQTLNFVASRIQNETAANRDSVLRLIFGIGWHDMVEKRVNAEDVAASQSEDVHTDVWLRLLEDLTSAPDCDESSSLCFFQSMGEQFLSAALDTCVVHSGPEYRFRGMTVTAKAWAEVGAEMIHRVKVVADGNKKTVESFQLSLSDSSCKTISCGFTGLLKAAEAEKEAGEVGADEKIASLHRELESTVDFSHGLYTKRVQAAASTEEVSEGDTMDWEDVEDDDSDQSMEEAEPEPGEPGRSSAGAAALRSLGQELQHFGGLVKLCGRSYSKVPMLQAKLESVVGVVATAGHAALHHIETFVAIVIEQHSKAHPFQEVPALVAYHDTLLRRFGTRGFGMQRNSRGGRSGPVIEGEELLVRWLSIHLPRKQEKAKMGRAVYQSRKASAVAALLDMSSSAIHIKLVWRFLVRHRQDLLGPYIAADSNIAGIFHPTDGGDEAQARAGAAAIQLSAQEEKDQEEEEEPDAYHLPATYGLRRLLQPQAAALAEKWKAMALDEDLSSAERTKGVARYCSSPAVAFSDQVATINELWSLQTDQLAIAKEAAAEEAAAAAAVTAADVTRDLATKADAVAAGKAARLKKAKATKASKVILPLPLSEALLEGMMRGDEPQAPFGFLLSPQMLARTEARVTMQVLNRAVGMIPPTDIAKFASLLLGNRDVRRAMKVTVHKALLRLLRHSTDEGPLLVLREWKRKELHRDVRVVILQCALELLHTSGDETMEEVWTILESAAADETLDPVVKATLLAPDRLKVPFGHELGSAADGLSKMDAQCTAGSEVHAGVLPKIVEDRYFEKVLCVLDEAELTVRVKQAEATEAAEAQVVALKEAATKVKGAQTKEKKKELTLAATALSEAQARACAADDLRALLATTLARWGEAPGRSAAVAKMLQQSVLDENTAVLSVDPGVEAASRNASLFRVLPMALAKVCLQSNKQVDGNMVVYPTAEMHDILEAAVVSLASRVMSVSLGERAVRNACFERLAALHDNVKNFGISQDQELLRTALAPMAWLREESQQMATLAGKRLPTEQEQRQGKKQRQGW